MGGGEKGGKESQCMQPGKRNFSKREARKKQDYRLALVVLEDLKDLQKKINLGLSW